MRVQGCNANGQPYAGAYVEHDRVPLDASKDGRTRQEFAAECDINVLLARYEKSGALNHYNAAEPKYFDVGHVPDLQEAHMIMQEAERAFMTLPAVVRREFDHEPLNFVKFLQVDPKDHEAHSAKLEFLRKHKLAAPAPVEPGPIRVEVVNPPEGGKPA